MTTVTLSPELEARSFILENNLCPTAHDHDPALGCEDGDTPLLNALPAQERVEARVTIDEEIGHGRRVRRSAVSR